jgi:hypothetical protein
VQIEDGRSTFFKVQHQWRDGSWHWTSFDTFGRPPLPDSLTAVGIPSTFSSIEAASAAASWFAEEWPSTSFRVVQVELEQHSIPLPKIYECRGSTD